MAARSVTMHRLQELVRLHRLKTSAREICRLLGMGRTTEHHYRQLLSGGGLLDGDPADLPGLDAISAVVTKLDADSVAAQEASSAEPWRSHIEPMVQRGAGPRAIRNYLRQHHPEFACSESAVKRFVARLHRERGVTAADVAIPVETGPGEVAQVDFGYIGKLYDPSAGTRLKTWVFVMALGFSRRSFACLVHDQRVETWLQCHVAAFEHFGGVPATLVPDNLKAAVIRCAFSPTDEGELNRSYVELARHYGFVIDPTPPYSPEKKGKVEAGVRYVKSSFVAPRDLSALDIDQASHELARWLREIADVRIHGTTRERPIDLFERVEKAALRPMPTARFEVIVWKCARVHRDSHVIFEKRLYSVPFRLIGQLVWVRATPESLQIYANDVRVASHDRRGKGHRSTTDAHLPEDRAPWRHRFQEFWMHKAAQLGPDVAKLVETIFGRQDGESKLRAVQAIVGLLEQYPEHRRNAVCRRALEFGNHTYQGIKQMLIKGLDLQPLPSHTAPKFGALESPRFTRAPSEFATPKTTE